MRVGFDKKLITLAEPEDKTRRKRRAAVPMNGMACTALLDGREGALTDDVIEWGGQRVASIKKRLKTAATNAGPDGVSAHVLRHRAAVWMAEAGVPMSEIAQYLGHGDSRVSERIYARYSPEYLKGAAKMRWIPSWFITNQPALSFLGVTP